MKILLIDNYDSFTYNLFHYISNFKKNVDVVRNDKIDGKTILRKKYNKVVISPGPGNPNQAGNCLKIVKEIHKKIPILGVCLGHQIIGQIFGGKIAKHSMMFINIITKKKREFLLESIASSFITLYKQKNNIETATVTTATKLNDDLKREVITFIEQQGNKKVELKEIINSKIIGGAIIRMGDKQLDTSVSKEISELRKIFNKNLYLQDY